MVLTIRVGGLFRFENRISRLFCRDSNPTIMVLGPCLRRLYFHRCLYVHRGGVSATPWADTLPVRHPPAQCMLGYGQQAGGMHPTGMHSCCFFLFFVFCFSFWCCGLCSNFQASHQNNLFCHSHVYRKGEM